MKKTSFLFAFLLVALMITKAQTEQIKTEQIKTEQIKTEQLKTATINSDSCQILLDSCKTQEITLLAEINSYKTQYKQLGFEITDVDTTNNSKVNSVSCKDDLVKCNISRDYLLRKRDEYKKMYEDALAKKENDKLTVATPSVKNCEADLANCRKDANKLRAERDEYKEKYEKLLAKTKKTEDKTKTKSPIVTAKPEEINIKELAKRSKTLAQQITFRNKQYDFFVVDTKQNTIQLFLKDDKERNYNFYTIEQTLKAKNKKLIFAMNGGMYQPNRTPVGLYIDNNKEISKLNSEKGEGNFYMQPNGVFGLTNKNEAFVVSTQDYPSKTKDVAWATQSGPMLLYNNEINGNFKDNSPNTNIRNGVGVIDSGKVVFIISNEKVNFYEFASLFKDVFGCQNALYLDGVVSQMFLPELKRTRESGVGLGPIITVIK